MTAKTLVKQLHRSPRPRKASQCRAASDHSRRASESHPDADGAGVPVRRADLMSSSDDCAHDERNASSCSTTRRTSRFSGSCGRPGTTRSSTRVVRARRLLVSAASVTRSTRSCCGLTWNSSATARSQRSRRNNRSGLITSTVTPRPSPAGPGGSVMRSGGNIVAPTRPSLATGVNSVSERSVKRPPRSTVAGSTKLSGVIATRPLELMLAAGGFSSGLSSSCSGSDAMSRTVSLRSVVVGDTSTMSRFPVLASYVPKPAVKLMLAAVVSTSSAAVSGSGSGASVTKPVVLALLKMTSRRRTHGAASPVMHTRTVRLATSPRGICGVMPRSSARPATSGTSVVPPNVIHVFGP
mmetsp:Transcript_41276/g.127505  ORF Transcript_41276/g.127505 Transcript_41276/m.127505 type:complete len:353 (+) Transcript_41276:394-1452(+)